MEIGRGVLGYYGIEGNSPLDNTPLEHHAHAHFVQSHVFDSLAIGLLEFLHFFFNKKGILRRKQGSFSILFRDLGESYEWLLPPFLDLFFSPLMYFLPICTIRDKREMYESFYDTLIIKDILSKCPFEVGLLSNHVNSSVHSLLLFYLVIGISEQTLWIIVRGLK